MVYIKRLKRPTRRSGFELPAGETTEIRGLTIVNNNKFTVNVDKFSGYKKRGKI